MKMENTKFDMFANLEERDFNEEVLEEIQETEVEVENPKKKFSTGIHRTKEEYEECIESVHYETLTHPTSGLEYSVKVTVLKPQESPYANMKQAFAYAIFQ